jgi:hypothetical protein
MNKRIFNPGKTLAGVTDWGIFIVASIMLYAKTSEVFAFFAPEKFFGFTGAEGLYGAICALLVEGVLVMAKLSIGSSENSMSYVWNVAVIVITWLMSAAMQLADGFLSATVLTPQQQTFQAYGTWIIPLVPSLILGVTLVKSIVAHLPEAPAAKQVVNVPANHRQNDRILTGILDRLLPVKTDAIATYNLDAAANSQKGSGANSHRQEVRRNELTAAEKDQIAGMTSRQIQAAFHVKERTARGWLKDARDGKL